MEQLKDRLSALIPCYDRQGGNATLIYTTGGEIIPDRRTVRWNLRRLARLYSVDLQAIRQNYGSYLGCRQGVPLPFSDGLVLVPLKIRSPLGKHDGCYGYINMPAVENISPDGDCQGRCIITFTGGHEVTCQYTCRTVRNKIRLAKIALDYYRQTLKSSGFNSLSPVWLKLIEDLIKAGIQESGNFPPGNSD